MSGGATSWTTDETLTLTIGARYKMKVSAVNGAGLTTVHYTDGVLVDPTPPYVSLFCQADSIVDYGLPVKSCRTNQVTANLFNYIEVR